MAYKRTVWENGVTPINAANLNNIEDGIEEAKTEVRSIEVGGTNADTAAAARQNINFIGQNPIASVEDDTVENWIALGTGVALIDSDGAVSNRPDSATGFIVNKVYSEPVSGFIFVSQTWHSLNGNSSVWYRSGNSEGWYAGSAEWVKSLDENSGIQKKLLWQNASKLGFPAQTLNDELLELPENFDAIAFVMTPYDLSGAHSGLHHWVNVGESARLLVFGSHIQYRDVIVTATGIEFKGGYVSWNMNGGYDANNDVNRPYQIYGIKGVQ